MSSWHSLWKCRMMLFIYIQWVQNKHSTLMVLQRTTLHHILQVHPQVVDKCTKITEGNLTAFAYRLFHEDFSSIVRAKCSLLLISVYASPHKLLRKTKVATYNHQADWPLGSSCLIMWFATLGLTFGNFIHDAQCPHWDQALLNHIKEGIPPLNDQV